MPEKTPDQTDPKITVTNGQICVAVVATYFIFAGAYNFRARAHNRRVLKEAAAIREQAANQPQTVQTVNDFFDAMRHTPTMYFCNN